MRSNLLLILCTVIVLGCDSSKTSNHNINTSLQIPPYDKNLFPDSMVLDCFDSVISIIDRPDIYSSAIPVRDVEAFVKTEVIPIIECDTGFSATTVRQCLERTRFLTLKANFGRDTLSIPVEQLMSVPDSIKGHYRTNRYFLDILPVPENSVLVRITLEQIAGEKLCGHEFFLFLRKSEDSYYIGDRSMIAEY